MKNSNIGSFITEEDYDSTLHSEIIDALTRSDDTVLEQCQNDAIAEMKGYLSARYDADAIFDARGDERNRLVLMYAKDIAIYHVFCVHNPYKMSTIRKERYERAMEWLKLVSQGKLQIADAPSLSDEDRRQRANFYIHSNPMNDPHY